MRPILTLLVALLWCAAVPLPAFAATLAEIEGRGELRPLGIRYTSFVTGAGDGFDLEQVQGFARRRDVGCTLVCSDFDLVVRDLPGEDAVNQGGEMSQQGAFPVNGDVIATGFTVLPWRDQVLLCPEPTFPSEVADDTHARLVQRHDPEIHRDFPDLSR